MRLLLVQMNPTVGDVRKNCARILMELEKAARQGIDCVLFPEQALCGYPADDLLLSSDFLALLDSALKAIIPVTKGTAACIGTVRRIAEWEDEKSLRNTAAICSNGQLLGFQDKTLLPNYDVFAERRYFSSHREGAHLWPIAGKKVAVTICEDIWHYASPLTGPHYVRDPIYPLPALFPDLVLNLSASPFAINRSKERLELCRKIARYVNSPVALCNQVGANDGLLFDGSSCVVDPKGNCLAEGPFCQEALIEVDLSKSVLPEQETRIETLSEDASLFALLSMGVRDYFRKTGHARAYIGLSGGIDSAVTACIAVEALGAKEVVGVAMPSQFSSPESLRDAEALAEHLKISFKVLPIETTLAAFCSLIRPQITEDRSGIMEENLQSRIRGTLLMALANAGGGLVLATGNKSEFAMGYTTLYGDLCGAIAVLGDLTKRRVYQVARYVNREKEVIPVYTLTRPPSAELRPGQLDSDTLPDYAILDAVVEDLVEKQLSCTQCAELREIPLTLVSSIAKSIQRMEYKRKQAPVILRVTSHTFGVGRQMPIVQG